jgi:hypothetical protein
MSYLFELVKGPIDPEAFCRDGCEAVAGRGPEVALLLVMGMGMEMLVRLRLRLRLRLEL